MVIIKATSTIRAALISVGVLICGIGASAQTEGQASTPGQTEDLAASSDTTVFRSGVTLVTTDVIPRDEHGVFLPDLAKEDFVVLEDGIPQEVASLVLVHGGRVFNQLLVPPPVQEGIILPPSRPVNDTAGRIFVIIVDDLHIEANKTPKTRQMFDKFAESLIHEGDLFGVISTGPSSIRVDLTYDRAMLHTAMEQIMGDGFTAMEMITDLSQGTRGPEELRWRAHSAFKTVRDTIRGLEQIENRRKVVIYVSSGYDFNPFAYERVMNRQPMGGDAGMLDGAVNNLYGQQGGDYIDPIYRLERQGEVFSEADLAMEIVELTDVANRANASFYTVDPRGLLAGPDIDFKGPMQAWREWNMTTRSSLRALAELTGGTAIVNRNDFDDAFREIDAETSDYYVLGFYSSNADPTARTRRLNVEVKRDNVEVKSRTHYTFARSNEQQPPAP